MRHEVYVLTQTEWDQLRQLDSAVWAGDLIGKKETHRFVDLGLAVCRTDGQYYQLTDYGRGVLDALLGKWRRGGAKEGRTISVNQECGDIYGSITGLKIDRL